MLTSKRTFGVEIETGFSSEDDIMNARDRLSGNIRFEHDGSIHDEEYPIEIVTPILTGSDGEKMIQKICATVSDCEGSDDNSSCSVHVHIGAEDFSSQTKLVHVENKDVHEFLNSQRSVIKNRFYINPKHYTFIVEKTGNSQRMFELLLRDAESLERSNDVLYTVSGIANKSICLTKFNGEIFVSLYSQDDKLGKMMTSINTTLYEKGEGLSSSDYTSLRSSLHNEVADKVAFDSEFSLVAELENSESLVKIKSLFYLYTAFSDIFTKMVPDSRKTLNAYCIPLGESFLPEEIEATKNYADLQKLWYRQSDDYGVKNCLQRKRDDSRYHDFNLHSLWYRYKTIEVRSHPPTLDANKILLWVKLHQHIIDKVASGITIRKMKDGKDIVDVAEKVRYFIKMLDLDETLEKYVIRLVSYYSIVKGKI